MSSILDKDSHPSADRSDESDGGDGDGEVPQPSRRRSQTRQLTSTTLPSFLPGTPLQLPPGPLGDFAEGGTDLEHRAVYSGSLSQGTSALTTSTQKRSGHKHSPSSKAVTWSKRPDRELTSPCSGRKRHSRSQHLLPGLDQWLDDEGLQRLASESVGSRWSLGGRNSLQHLPPEAAHRLDSTGRPAPGLGLSGQSLPMPRPFTYRLFPLPGSQSVAEGRDPDDDEPRTEMSMVEDQIRSVAAGCIISEDSGADLPGPDALAGDDSWDATKARVYVFLERPALAGTWARVLSWFSLLMIVSSCTSLLLETLPHLRKETIWNHLEAGFVAFFTLEYLVRLWSSGHFSESRLRFARQPLNVVDVLSVLPFYIRVASGKGEGLNLAFLRLIRVLRVFKVLRSESLEGAGALIKQVFGAAADTLYLVVFVVCILVAVASSCVYYIERAEARWDETNEVWLQYHHTGENAGQWLVSPFQSVPATMWWCIVSVVGVGFGDAYPTSYLGKAVAGVVILVGLVLMTLPTSVVASHFQRLLNIRQKYGRGWEAFITEKYEQARIKDMKIRNAELLPQLFHLVDTATVAESDCSPRSPALSPAPPSLEVEKPTGAAELEGGEDGGEAPWRRRSSVREASAGRQISDPLEKTQPQSDCGMLPHYATRPPPPGRTLSPLVPVEEVVTPAETPFDCSSSAGADDAIKLTKEEARSFRALCRFPVAVDQVCICYERTFTFTRTDPTVASFSKYARRMLADVGDVYTLGLSERRLRLLQPHQNRQYQSDAVARWRDKQVLSPTSTVGPMHASESQQTAHRPFVG